MSQPLLRIQKHHSAPLDAPRKIQRHVLGAQLVEAVVAHAIDGLDRLLAGGLLCWGAFVGDVGEMPVFFEAAAFEVVDFAHFEGA